MRLQVQGFKKYVYPGAQVPYMYVKYIVKIILIILSRAHLLGISRITVKQQRVGQDSSKDNILLVFFGMEQKCNYDA
jgi:hypothetical protein